MSERLTNKRSTKQQPTSEYAWGNLKKIVEMQAQHGPDRLNKSRAGLDEDRSARVGSMKTGRLLEVYDPSLAYRHISRS